MTFQELLRRDRSFRSFRPTPALTRGQLEELVGLTRLCPSSGNLQPLKYRIVSGAQGCERLTSLTRWGGRMRKPSLPPAGMGPTAYIVILHDTRIAPNPAAFARDVGIVAHTMLLAAAEMGFGGCMIGGFSPDAISEALRLPACLVPALLVALGAPGEEVVLCDAPEGSLTRDTAYYRDENNVHHVPKRTLSELLDTQGEEDADEH